MVLRIFTCIHGRHAITRAFFKHVHFLRYTTGRTLPVTFGYSEDADLDNVKDLLQPGDQPVKAPNKPLSEKHNIAMDALIKDTTESHVLHLGSDDFCTPFYIDYVNENPCDFGGLKSIYFAELESKKAKHMSYNKKNKQVLGAGRIYSRELLERMVGKKYRARNSHEYHIPESLAPLMVSAGEVVQLSSRHGNRCALWMRHCNHGLDNNAWDTVRKMGYSAKVFEFSKPQIVDLKSDENITAYSKLTGKPVKFEEAMKLVSCKIDQL